MKNFLITLFLVSAFCVPASLGQFIVAGQYGENDNYYDYDPDSLVECDNLTGNCTASSFLLDMNGDGTNDFTIDLRNNQGALGAGTVYVRITSLNNNQVSPGDTVTCVGFDICADESWNYALANDHQVGDTISENLNWVEKTSHLLYLDTWRMDCKNCEYDISNGGSTIIGTRIFTENDTLYGWIKLKDLSAWSYSAHFIIMEYACNKFNSQPPTTGPGSFAPIGSKWYYSQPTVNPWMIGFTSFEVLSDTIINGDSCRKILEVKQVPDTVQTIYHYMYERNDRVFFYADNKFHLLYDFGASQGDTIILDYFLTHDGSPLEVYVNETGPIIYNGVERKIQYITSGDGIVVEFGNHIIEGIGNTHFMFPVYDGNPRGPLRCYHDDSTGWFMNPLYPDTLWNHTDCDQIISGIDQTNTSNFKVYPNPVQEQLYLNNLKGSISYVITDLLGHTVMKGILKDGTPAINVVQLPNGIYLLRIETDKGVQISKFLKME